MKRILLTTIASIASFCAMSQSSPRFINHGIGAHLGFASEGNKTISPEYEISFLSDAKGYKSGFVGGAGISLPIQNKTNELKKAFYLKGGYRLSSLSFGVNLGTKNIKDAITPETYYEFLAGGWLGVHVSNRLKLEVGGDSFNGFRAGLVLYPNTIKGNR